MALFGRKAGKDAAAKEGGAISKFTKPKRFLFFKTRAKPIFGSAQQRAAQIDKSNTADGPVQAGKEVPTIKVGYRRPNHLQMYLLSVAAKQKDLELTLRAQGIKVTPYEFVKKMFAYALILCAIITITFAVMLNYFGFGLDGYALALLLGVAVYQTAFRKFVRYPIDRSKVEGQAIERDILFAARDLVVSMRSGMPLFNAMAAVSTGYGSASKEFAKVVELIQLGTPTEQAIDSVSSKSQSKTFKRIMLQANVSIRVGADVVGALQGVVDEVMQERIIELRRYGQRLNALAMFYMLFGVIFPSMGIAIAAILTTFINIFTVSETTLMFAVVGIFFLQIIFLNIMRTSRPAFSM